MKRDVRLYLADDLDYLEHRFTELEVIAQEWARHASEDQNDFLFDWPLVEDRLQTLLVRVEQTSIPTQQQPCYNRLIARIAGDRALLDRIRRT